MRLSFSGFENSLDIYPGQISILQIESIQLFSRVCQSLLVTTEYERLESFTLWSDEGKEIANSNAFLSVFNPFDLPWHERALISALFDQVEMRLQENEDIRQQIECMHRQFEHLITEIGLQFDGNYSFGVEWRISQALKAYSFGIDRADTVSLLDNVIRFLEFLHDICYKKPILFVNLSNFLDKKELLELESQLFFHNLSALLLVQGSEKLEFSNAKKLFIDQEFLETLS